MPNPLIPYQHHKKFPFAFQPIRRVTLSATALREGESYARNDH
jgi:hypothetical protein